MGYELSRSQMDEIFSRLTTHYDVYAPVLKKGEGTFSDTDVIRYDTVHSLDEIEWEKRSDYSFKEVLFPVNETLFYFTEDETTVPKAPEKGRIIFLRSCDIHAVKRLDQIYLKNGFEDFYYARIREKTLFFLMGCPGDCDGGFCAGMGTNTTKDYDMYIKLAGDKVYTDIKNPQFTQCFDKFNKADVTPDFVSENKEQVTLPTNLPKDVIDNPIWKDYGSRCITCGRCNFACPTCTCFSMQDIFYKDNENVGERRRVWASCQVDGYTDIAGGHNFRDDKGSRMRFKVMHKIYDFEKRFGYPMCVGCGRCDTICPEYISYKNIVNRLADEYNEKEGK